MNTLQWVSNYSKEFDNFNDDVIVGIRKNDDMVVHIDETFREVQKHLPKNMEYLGYHYDDSGKRFRELNVGKDKEKKEVSRKTMSIYDTIARMVVFDFKLTDKNPQTGEIETVFADCPLYIPLYVDDYHFYIRGNKYSAPYQITDAITYTNKNNMVVLKTKSRAIKLTRERKSTPIVDAHGEKYISNVYYSHMAPKKVPFLLYYFAHFGFMNTMRYFGADKFIKFVKEAPLEPDDKFIYFKFCTIYIAVDREAFGKYYNLRQFIFTTLETQKRSMDVEDIENTSRWKVILGSTISDSDALKKGEGLINTFNISADDRTIKNIAEMIGGYPKNNMWSIMRWMFVNFSTLSSKTQNLLNKRIRVSEWIIDPFVKETYRKLYRYLSTPEKNRDMKRLLDIINISDGFILGAICGKNRKGLSLDIAKYSSGVNDNSLTKDALKYTTAGPGTPGSAGGSLTSSTYRTFNTSYVGRIDIYHSSNSDPGTSGCLVPTAKIDLRTMTFSKEI